MSQFIFKYKLKQETPLIHFQHSEEGAILRSSEVKPKLDKFIIEQYGGENEVRKLYNYWFIDGDHPAFKYKMRFIVDGIPTKSDTIETEKKRIQPNGSKNKVLPKNPINANYFGNMVDLKNCRTPEEKYAAIERSYKETIFYSNSNSTIRMEIVCFIPELMEELNKHIIAFFLLNNFGTRQNKGFGSFTVTHKEDQKLNYNPISIIKEYFKHRFFVVNNNSSNPMEDIRKLYKLMKSGVNQNGEYFRAFIYIYMHKKGIGNEKAKMKQKNIVPIVGKKSNTSKHECDKPPKFDAYKYVRAMLGIGDNVSYLNAVNPENGRPVPGGKTTVNISHKESKENEKIERYASPIVFKIVDKRIIILPYAVNNHIFNQKFMFDNKKVNLEIFTPEFFDMDDFMLAYKDYINVEIREQLIKSKEVKFHGRIDSEEVGGASK
ncbi:MAG: hypothetical protein LBT51_08990 [Fusobacteriaceae bacterium]|nr:hypothetical protein [Fusobacteriaceae bacterium]